VFALDPPPRSAAGDAVRHSAGEGPAFLHLGYGAAEVEFAGRVLDHELSLRPHLEAIYRALSSLAGPGATVPRETLEGDSRHPRGAAVVGRCMRVLAELSLASFDRSSGTLRCTITNSGRADLERSQAFRACAKAAAEGHRFLATLTPETQKARAA